MDDLGCSVQLLLSWRRQSGSEEIEASPRAPSHAADPLPASPEFLRPTSSTRRCLDLACISRLCGLHMRVIDISPHVLGGAPTIDHPSGHNAEIEGSDW